MSMHQAYLFQKSQCEIDYKRYLNGSRGQKLRYELSLSEKKVLARMGGEERAKNFIFSRVLLRALLHQKFHLSQNEKIELSQTGKPYLKESSLYFNYSHSGDFIFFGFSQQAPVGVDVETQIKTQSFHKVAKKYFSPQENHYIQVPRQTQDQHTRFKLLWALKEAYFKTQDQPVTAQSHRIYFDLFQFKVKSLPYKGPTQFFYKRSTFDPWCLAYCTKETLKTSSFKAFQYGWEKGQLVNKGDLSDWTPLCF